MLPVVILCGGLGTRLRPAVSDRPKVLAPVAGEPFLGHLLAHLERQGVQEVVLSTGYLGEQIAEYAGNGAHWDLRIRYAEEPEPLGTGGALRFAAKTARLDEAFIAMNGDTFFSGNLKWLIEAHETREAVATLALVEVEEDTRYGTVETDETGAVTAFWEKEAARTAPAWINAGVYVLGPALIAMIPEGKVSLERDVFPRFVGRGLYGSAFPDADFLDIGTPEDYGRAATVLERSGG